MREVAATKTLKDVAKDAVTDETASPWLSWDRDPRGATSHKALGLSSTSSND